MRIQLDTDFLIYALSQSGPERSRLRNMAESDAVLEISAIAWYEFCRGPRSPEQIAVARSVLAADGIVAFGEPLAARAAEIFRRLGSPRQRASDIAIGVTAAATEALLLTRNARDFVGIPDLQLESVS
jgi:predicted nucleic acid-binding protein